MKRTRRPRHFMHPQYDLIATVQESAAADLIEHQIMRGRQRFAYETQKLVLLILMFLSLWIMFFLLWEKLDDFRPDVEPPALERISPSLPAPSFGEPIATDYIV